MDIINWVQNNYKDIFGAITALVTFASVVVKLTPTLADDNVLLPVIKFLGRYIALNRTTDDEAIRATDKVSEGLDE